MELFSDERTTLTGIRTVARFVYDDLFSGGERVRHYDVTLRTYELIFFLSGNNPCTFAGKCVRDTENSVRYLPKGIAEGSYTVERCGPSDCIDVYFDTDAPMPPVMLSYPNMGEMRGLFERIFRVWQAKRPGYYAQSMAILYEIVARFRTRWERYCPDHLTEKLAPAQEYLMTHYDSPAFDYRKMCETTGLSYDYFKELFTKKYGVSPVRQVNALRIAKAKELLLTRRYRVGEVARLCGYADVYYFSAVFKKETGVPPTQYPASEL